MKNIIVLILFLITLFFVTGCIEKPIVDQKQITFVNGKIVPYEKYNIIHTDPEVELKLGDPVAISEKPVLIHSWKRLIIVKEMKYFEGEQKQIKVFDYKGKFLNESNNFTGEPLFLEKTNRILLAQKSSHYLIEKSQILDSDGKVVAEVRQAQNVFKFGHSDDDKVIWIISNTIKDGKPFTGIQIVDFNGKLIEVLESEQEEINFIYKSRSYKFSVPAPQIPG